MHKWKLIAAAVIMVGGFIGLAASELPDHKAAGRIPVLLELFTSEGCSSCPPADRLLEKLDREQPVVGADLIVLSEHVDYWNYLGWSDPYSLPAFSQRQHDYAVKLGTEEVYTPQLVVDGKKHFVGSNRAAALSAIEEAMRAPKALVRLQVVRNGVDVEVHLEVGGGAGGVAYLALASEREKSQVARGENAGHELGHVAVAYSIKKIGTVSHDAGLQKDLRVGVRPGGARIIVVVQDAKTGSVVGVAQGRV